MRPYTDLCVWVIAVSDVERVYLHAVGVALRFNCMLLLKHRPVRIAIVVLCLSL
jgi:hypothetical protein